MMAVAINVNIVLIFVRFGFVCRREQPFLI